MNTKEMLLANNDLRDWWSGVANDGRFNQVLLYAQGIALEIIPSAEQRIGVMAMKEILLTIHEPEAAPVQFADPGLDHNLEHSRKTVDLNAPKKTKTKK